MFWKNILRPMQASFGPGVYMVKYCTCSVLCGALSVHSVCVCVQDYVFYMYLVSSNYVQYYV